MRLSFIVAGCALAALSASGHAQSYGVAQVDDGNLRFTATLTGVGTATGQLLSGTKCEVAFTVSATTRPAGGGSTHIYESWGMITPSLKIGTTSIPGLPPEPDAGEPYSTTVRFASNHFNHNEDIPIEGKIYVFGVDKDANGTVIGVGTVLELKPEVLPKAYNVGRCWTTFVDENGVPESDDPPTGAYQGKKACQNFCDVQPSPFKHDAPTADAPLFRLQQAGTVHTLQDRLVQATVIHAETHGSVSGLADSYTPFVNPWSALEGFLMTSRAVPTPNFVAAYACATVEDDQLAAKCFRVVTSGGAVIPDKAYVGFRFKVYPYTYTQEDHLGHFLSGHSAELYAQLADGVILKEAVASADAYFPAFSTPEVLPGRDQQVEMEIEGDGNLRLYNVYMTDAEISSHGSLVETWYLVVSP